MQKQQQRRYGVIDVIHQVYSYVSSAREYVNTAASRISEAEEISSIMPDILFDLNDLERRLDKCKEKLERKLIALTM